MRTIRPRSRSKPVYSTGAAVKDSAVARCLEERAKRLTLGPWLQSKWSFPPPLKKALIVDHPFAILFPMRSPTDEPWEPPGQDLWLQLRLSELPIIYILEKWIWEKKLSHSGRLAFSLPNSPNETSFTHLVDDPEDVNKAPFCLIPIPLKREWSSGSAPSYYWGGVEAMAPDSQRDSFPNHSCSLLPASQLDPISLSKSHLNEAPPLLNATLISTFFLLYWNSFSICLDNLSFPTRH